MDPRAVQEQARPSPGEPRRPLRQHAGGHFAGLPVVADGAGRVPALGCGTACFSPIPEGECLRWRRLGTGSARPAGTPEGCAIRHRGEGDARGAQDSTNVPGNDVHQIGAHPQPGSPACAAEQRPARSIASGLGSLLRGPRPERRGEQDCSRHVFVDSRSCQTTTSGRAPLPDTAALSNRRRDPAPGRKGSHDRSERRVQWRRCRS